MAVRYRDVVFLLGAGASAEAGIPTSAKMVEEIEASLGADPDWQKYKQLYYHIKSGIYYAAGLRGEFNSNVSYNIEALVNTLYELERNEEHPLYPFIASMNSRLISLAGMKFETVHSFRMRILEKLKKWMYPDDLGRTSEYYQGLRKLQQVLNFPVQVFSLNYDTCVESLESEGFKVEAGFAGYGRDASWGWERFEVASQFPEVFLYKLHGSIDWKRDSGTKKLYRVQQTAGIDPENMELIFGREFKLTAADPYLFYLFALRAATLSAKLIVSVGYGFGDSHINDVLSQAIRLQDGRKCRLLVVGNCRDDNACQTEKERIARLLSTSPEQIDVLTGGAKGFFESSSLSETLMSKVPIDPEAPF